MRARTQRCAFGNFIRETARKQCRWLHSTNSPPSPEVVDGLPSSRMQIRIGLAAVHIAFHSSVHTWPVVQTRTETDQGKSWHRRSTRPNSQTCGVDCARKGARHFNLTSVDHQHEDRSGSKCTIRRLAVGRRGRIESGRLTPESAFCVMRCSDFRGDDYQLEVQAKHRLTDRPRGTCSAHGPTLPDAHGGTSDAIGGRATDRRTD